MRERSPSCWHGDTATIYSLQWSRFEARCSTSRIVHGDLQLGAGALGILLA
jgi:hypothetical protein